MSLYRKGSRVQALPGTEPRGLTLLLGSPPWPHLQQGLPSPTLGSLQGPPEGQLGGQRLQRPPVQLTHDNLQWPSQAHAGPCWAGLGWAKVGDVGRRGPMLRAASHCFRKGLLQKRRLHTCAKRIWSRSTRGLSFALKKQKERKQKTNRF